MLLLHNCGSQRAKSPISKEKAPKASWTVVSVAVKMVGACGGRLEDVQDAWALEGAGDL